MSLDVALLLSFFVTLSVCDQRDAKISTLESRVSVLESQLSSLESDLVIRYGLVRRCPLPRVLDGSVTCDSEDRIPGTKCSASCEPGYIVTPGQGVTSCQDNGAWDVELKCEVPLMVVSGGTVDGNQRGDSGVEVLSFHNSTGCEYKIPDMLQTGDGEHRIMHNLIYVPHSPNIRHDNASLLACNGLTTSAIATCDSWNLGDSKWTHHSNPNIGSKVDELYRSISNIGRDKKESKLILPEAGRYAASSLTTDREPYVMIIGGMIFNAAKHIPTNSIRMLGKRRDQKHWSKSTRVSLSIKRAFFCTAEYKTGRFVAIGGYSGKVEDSMEDLYTGEEFPAMAVARSGHACTGMGGGKILVSGGSRRDGARAMAGSELFNGQSKQWEMVGEMVKMRFGHALVNLGGRIIAVGGKERQPDVVLDTAEEYDSVSKSWSSIGKVLDKPRANFGFTLIPHSLIPGCKVYQN